MKTTRFIARLLAVLFTVSFAAAPAFAKKGDDDDKHGGGHKSEKHERKADKHERKAEKHERKAEKHEMKAEMKADKREAKAERKAEKQEIKVGGHFNDSHRTVVRTYYNERYGSGKACPPGLAKKNNGCMPPGQAKKYVVGQPLPSSVRYYSVPQPVLVQLPPAPIGYRYVVVNGDVVLMASSSRIIADALTGLLMR